MSYFVYIVECVDKSFYTGYTTDLKRRVEEHNNSTKGAKYTKGRTPVVLRYFEEYTTVNEALKREHDIKKLSRLEKENLFKKLVIV